MVDNKTLAKDLASKISYKPTADLLLVKPLKPVMISKLLPTAPTQTFTSTEEAENSEPTEPTKQKVEANVSKGIVLKLGTDYEKSNPEGLEIGDTVLFLSRAGMPFELLKNARLLRRFEIVAVERLTPTV